MFEYTWTGHQLTPAAAAHGAQITVSSGSTPTPLSGWLLGWLAGDCATSYQGALQKAKKQTSKQEEQDRNPGKRSKKKTGMDTAGRMCGKAHQTSL